MNQEQEQEYITIISGLTIKTIKQGIRAYNIIITIEGAIKRVCEHCGIVPPATEYAPIKKYSRLKRKDLIEFINKNSFKAYIMFFHPTEKLEKIIEENRIIYSKECGICCEKSTMGQFRECETCHNEICRTCVGRISVKCSETVSEYKCPYCRTSIINF